MDVEEAALDQELDVYEQRFSSERPISRRAASRDWRDFRCGRAEPKGALSAFLVPNISGRMGRQ
jgi:hypothetical protein